jgi:hypothetical protein
VYIDLCVEDDETKADREGVVTSSALEKGTDSSKEPVHVDRLYDTVEEQNEPCDE